MDPKFCVEQADLPEGIEVDDLELASPLTTAPTEASPRSLTISVIAPHHGDALYAAPHAAEAAGTAPFTVTAIPFSSWGNRTPGAMRVWIPVSTTTDTTTTAPKEPSRG